VHASLYERHDGDPDGLGFNTAICVAPGGEVIARTRKVHIPVTAGYYEDRYFRPGDTVTLSSRGRGETGVPDLLGPVVPRAGARVLAGRRRGDRLPDRNRVRARPPRLRHRAAMGEGDRRQRHRERDVHGRGESDRRGRTAVASNGSSFISDPYGRKLVQAGRDEPAVLVADLDLDQRRDWLALFPFLARAGRKPTRRWRSPSRRWGDRRRSTRADGARRRTLRGRRRAELEEEVGRSPELARSWPSRSGR